MRKASIKETGEEISQADWARFDAAVARAKAERAADGCRDTDGLATGRRERRNDTTLAGRTPRQASES